MWLNSTTLDISIFVNAVLEYFILNTNSDEKRIIDSNVKLWLNSTTNEMGVPTSVVEFNHSRYLHIFNAVLQAVFHTN